MSEAKFTKGEWQVFRDGCSIGCESSMGIAELWRGGEERKANANLIACAPEMYAMLDSVRQCLEWGYTSAELEDNLLKYREEINELLAKARGEE